MTGPFLCWTSWMSIAQKQEELSSLRFDESLAGKVLGKIREHKSQQTWPEWRTEQHWHHVEKKSWLCHGGQKAHCIKLQGWAMYCEPLNIKSILLQDDFPVCVSWVVTFTVMHGVTWHDQYRCFLHHSALQNLSKLETFEVWIWEVFDMQFAVISQSIPHTQFKT